MSGQSHQVIVTSKDVSSPGTKLRKKASEEISLFRRLIRLWLIRIENILEIEIPYSIGLNVFFKV